MVYLDNAATTFPKPECVYKKMDYVARNGAVNAGRGSYALAQEATHLIEETKDMLKSVVGVKTDAEVVFTPSITLSMNQIVLGMKWSSGDVVYVSPYEHNSVARTLNYCQKRKDITIKELPIEANSMLIDIDKMKYEFAKNHPKAIFCTHISNVTGYILPIKEIFAEGKRYNSTNILDSAQSLGLLEIDAANINADLIAFTAHKSLYGPIGVGGFINISGVDIDEIIVGGTGSDSLNLEMPTHGATRFEAGSQNIVAIAGLNEALRDIDIKQVFNHERALTVMLREQMADIKGVRLLLPGDLSKHIGIISFIVKGMNSNDVADILNEDFDIAVRSGYHCAPFIHKYLKDEKSLGTVRVGLGQFNTIEDINVFTNAVKEVLIG